MNDQGIRIAQIGDEVLLMTWAESAGKVTSIELRSIDAVCFSFMANKNVKQ